MSRPRRLLLSDKRRRQKRRMRFLPDFEIGEVYITCSVDEIASVPTDLLLQPGDTTSDGEAQA